MVLSDDNSLNPVEKQFIQLGVYRDIARKLSKVVEEKEKPFWGRYDEFNFKNSFRYKEDWGSW